MTAETRVDCSEWPLSKPSARHQTFDWTAPNATDPLARKVMTTEFRGNAWHKMEPLKEADGREGLVGLLVDPATPNRYQVIHWSPEAIEAALAGTAPVLNHAPLARVLPTPASGAGRSAVALRVWDAEAHAATVALQFQLMGSSTWTATRLLSVNGGAAGIGGPLSSLPGGMTHQFLWDAATDLGATFAGTVLLRAQASDAETGAWSDPMPYAVNTSADRDTDADGVLDLTELAFGTNPNASTSRPALGVTRNTNGSYTFTWPTTTGRTYILESSADLTTGTWTTVQSLTSTQSTATVTVTPPVSGGGAGQAALQLFYRVRVE